MRGLQIPDLLTIPNFFVGWSTISPWHHPDALFFKKNSLTCSPVERLGLNRGEKWRGVCNDRSSAITVNKRDMQSKFGYTTLNKTLPTKKEYLKGCGELLRI